MLEDDNDLYECNITIKQIKLTVKFPCKLTLNYQSKVIKADVSSDSTGKYIIDRQVKTKSQNNQPLEILIHLTTEKGGNIMAGIIKLNPKDLSSSEGQSLTVGLQKCLDQGASCLLKVQRVWLTKTAKAKSLMGEISSRNRKSYGDQMLGSSKKLPPTIVDNYRNVETRSELPGFNMKKPSGLRKQFGFDNAGQGNKLYGLGPKSYVPEINVGKSKNIDRSIELRREGKFRIDDDNKTVGKREVDPSYRLTVEANEKNLKMDIMKYKMKAEEQEKTIEEKNKQIKALKEEVSQLHRQSVEKGFYQEQINSKNVTIQKLQDTNKSLNKQNSRLESRIIELQRAVQQGKSNLQSSLQRAKDQKQRRQTQMGKQLNMKKDQISMLNDELRSKNNQISRIKKIIEDLQKSLQAKTFDHEKSIQSQRAQMAKLQSLLNDKIRQLQQINKSVSSQRQNLQSQLKKKTQIIQKLQTNTNHLMGEIKQVTELQKYYATYKQKYTELQKAFQKLQQQKKQVQKHYLKLMQTKQKDYGQFKQQQSGLINSYKKKNNQLTEKTKQQTTRIHQLQNKTTLLVSDMDKLKRSLQLAQKQLSSLTQNWKQLNQSIKQKDQLLLNKQKQLSELEAKLASKQSLMKKDLQYKTQQLTKLITRVSELQHLYRQEKELNEGLRFQATKMQGKIKLQEEIISRMNRQIDQHKSIQEKRQIEYKQELKQLNDKITAYEQTEKRLNKTITDHEIQDLNHKNQINKLHKQLDILKDKLQRHTKKYHQLQTTVKQLHQLNSKLQHNLLFANQELKDLQNSNKALQADFTKTQKIKTIIVEEKTSAQNQLQNLKKEIQVKANQQLVLNKQIKELKEELNKAIIKGNNSSKDFETFKQNLYTTIQSAFFSSTTPTTHAHNWIKNSFNFFSQSPKTHQRYNSSSNIHQPQTYNSRGPLTKRLNQSQVLSLNNNQRSSLYEPRFNQIIQCYGRESQQAISQLSQTIKKHKQQIERLQRQSTSLSSRLQSTEQQSSQLIKQLQVELEKSSRINQEQKNQLEERLMMSQRANRQKQQVIEELNQQLEMINHQLAANARTHQIQLQELALKIQQLKSKLYDLQAKNDFSAMTILSNQEKIFLLQSNLSQLQEQLQFQRAKVQRKDKLIIQHTAKIDQINKSLEQLKTQKLSLNRQLLTLQQKLQAQRQSNNKHKKLLQEEQQKNKQIKGLTNNLIKQKQTIVKNQIIKSQKVIELEDVISRYKIQKDQLVVESQCKDASINTLKGQVKKHQLTIKELQHQLQHQQHQKLKLIQLNKQNLKKLQEKDLQLKNLQINLQKVLSKYEQQTNKLNYQHEETIKKFTKQLQEKKTTILELTNEMEKLKHLEKKLSEQNISLEEQIFFEKQTNSLANSRFDHMNRDIDGLQAKLSQSLHEIQSLGQQIRDRQQKLFQLSNKLYSQQTKLQHKQTQMRQRLQKLDIDWKNKYQQTLEDYQAKIQSYERQKIYLRQKLQEEQDEIAKLQQEKRTIMMQQQSYKKIYQDKIKKIQSQRLSLLQDKNKQLQKLRIQLQELQHKLKQTKHLTDIKQDEIHRLQEKLKDKQQRLHNQQDKHQLSIGQLEKELEHQKKKEAQLKKYKQTIKNNLWSSERQVKRILQTYIKNLMALCEQDKKNSVIDVMKNVETQIVKAIEITVEDV